MRIPFQIIGFLSLVSLSGCSLHAQGNISEQAEQEKVAQSEQSRGLMSASDYKYLNTLGDKNGAGKPLSDAEIDQCIAIMHKPSKRPGEMQSYVMGIFFDDKNMTPAQKTRVRAVVKPLLSSPSKLARTTAQLAMKRLR